MYTYTIAKQQLPWIQVTMDPGCHGSRLPWIQVTMDPGCHVLLEILRAWEVTVQVMVHLNLKVITHKLLVVSNPRSLSLSRMITSSQCPERSGSNHMRNS